MAATTTSGLGAARASPRAASQATAPTPAAVIASTNAQCRPPGRVEGAARADEKCGQRREQREDRGDATAPAHGGDGRDGRERGQAQRQRERRTRRDGRARERERQRPGADDGRGDGGREPARARARRGGVVAHREVGEDRGRGARERRRRGRGHRRQRAVEHRQQVPRLGERARAVSARPRVLLGKGALGGALGQRREAHGVGRYLGARRPRRHDVTVPLGARGASA